MECSLNGQDIKLSEPVVIVYNNENMETMVRKDFNLLDELDLYKRNARSQTLGERERWMKLQIDYQN
ncbi:unnamed protein product [Rhizophagus irregularis]|uniref:Uncharacterized protein n=1 Tax=Rhizophagus irregularis TaxID=588596 RepID=A0A915ZR96_9GLOM|nr:unnamed protein product [Rhizophagus irregularis]